MRITTNMMMNSQTKAINQNLTKYHQVSEQLYSGKLITKPSQNPYFTTKIMDYKKDISQKEQYKRNIDHATTQLNEADSSLADINSVMLRIKELTTKAGNDTNSPEDKEAIANEIDQLVNTISDALNKQIDGKPVFVKPGDDKLSVDINSTSSVDCNVDYDSVVGSNPDIFETLENLVATIKNPDATKEDFAQYTQELEDHSTNILSVRTKIGATVNRLDAAAERTDNEILSLKSLLSNIEDVDYAEKFIELESTKAIYSASLQVSASMMQQSLLNFLR